MRGRNSTFAAARAIDGDNETYWSCDDNVTNATIELQLDTEHLIYHVDLGEYLPLGQRVRSFVVEVFAGGQWHQVATGTTIGNRRILQFDPITTARLRINITDSRATPAIRHLRVYETAFALD